MTNSELYKSLQPDISKVTSSEAIQIWEQERRMEKVNEGQDLATEPAENLAAPEAGGGVAGQPPQRIWITCYADGDISPCWLDAPRQYDPERDTQRVSSVEYVRADSLARLRGIAVNLQIQVELLEYGAREALAFLDPINTTHVAAQGLSKEASAISGARVELDKMISHPTTQAGASASAPSQAVPDHSPASLPESESSTHSPERK